jgi:endonuclease-3
LVADRLAGEHVPEEPRPSGRPLDELVATILSQHTSDHNSRRAFARLKAAMPRWSDVLAAGAAAVADAIRPGGLAEQKAPWIISLLRTVPIDDDGEPSLDHLRHLTPAAAFAELVGYSGVGPKTAACTLLFAYNWPVFPVDVHVHRLARRLGWAGPKETAERTQRRLMELVPPPATYGLHMGMVRHGRRVCRPVNPRCHACVLADLCVERPGGAVSRQSEQGPG